MDWNIFDKCTRLSREIDDMSLTLMRPFYEEYEISFLKLSILGQISKGSAVTLNVLAQKLSKAAANLSVVITQMEEEGYVVRNRSKSDGRIMFFQITDKGDLTLKKSHEYVAKVFGEVFEGCEAIDELVAAQEKYKEKIQQVIDAQG